MLEDDVQVDGVRADGGWPGDARAHGVRAEGGEDDVPDDGVLIDCDSCEVRGVACGDCVVTVLLGAPPAGVRLDAEERSALDVLAASGLVPPLRLVIAEEPPGCQHDTG